MSKLVWLFGFVALLNFSCSQQSGDNTVSDSQLQGVGLRNWDSDPRAAMYSIVDQNQQPIVGAQILIGNAVNSPLKDNFIQSDTQGQFAIPAGWTTPQNLTIDAKGFVRVTYMHETPAARTIVLKRMKLAPSHEVKGITSGHPIQNGDGLIDFSLVMAAMTKEEIMNLDLNKVISPQTDAITVVGQTLNVPSNVSLPKQKESYIIGITLEKPVYRLYFEDSGPQKIYAARGRFQFKPVVDQLRNNVPFFDLLNQFTIIGGSVKEAQVNGASTALDITVNDFTFSQSRKLQAPELSSDQVMIAASVADMNGYMIPTDVKKLNSKETMSLSVLPDHPSLIAQVLKRKAEFMVANLASDRLSAVLVPFTDNSHAQFLSLIADPAHTSDFSYQFQLPQKPTTVNAIATYVSLSDVKDNYSTHRWEIYSPVWETNLELPQWELGVTQTKKMVEVSFVGSLNTTRVEMGPKVIEAATHVSRSSIQY